MRGESRKAAVEAGVVLNFIILADITLLRVTLMRILYHQRSFSTLCSLETSREERREDGMDTLINSNNKKKLVN